jgi:hypothetical protein
MVVILIGNNTPMEVTRISCGLRLFSVMSAVADEERISVVMYIHYMRSLYTENRPVSYGTMNMK